VAQRDRTEPYWLHRGGGKTHLGGRVPAARSLAPGCVQQPIRSAFSAGAEPGRALDVWDDERPRRTLRGHCDLNAEFESLCACRWLRAHAIRLAKT